MPTWPVVDFLLYLLQVFVVWVVSIAWFLWRSVNTEDQDFSHSNPCLCRDSLSVLYVFGKPTCGMVYWTQHTRSGPHRPWLCPCGTCGIRVEGIGCLVMSCRFSSLRADTEDNHVVFHASLFSNRSSPNLLCMLFTFRWTIIASVEFAFLSSTIVKLSRELEGSSIASTPFSSSVFLSSKFAGVRVPVSSSSLESIPRVVPRGREHSEQAQSKLALSVLEARFGHTEALRMWPDCARRT